MQNISSQTNKNLNIADNALINHYDLSTLNIIYFSFIIKNTFNLN